MELFSKQWWVENLQLQESSDEEVLSKVIKGFKLVKTKHGFNNAYVTEKGKATANLANRINTWIKTNFPYSNLKVGFEKTYGTVNFLIPKQSLQEEEGKKKNLALLKEFIKFTLRELGIRGMGEGMEGRMGGKIVLSHDVETARDMKTMGTFNPNDGNIWIYIGNRNLADICRTIAHELTHFKQKQDGVNMDGSTGSDVENEANSKAGEIMRKFGEQNPMIYENKQ